MTLQTQQEFLNNFNHGQQLAVLRGLVQGNTVTQDMVKTFFSGEYQINHPITVKMFTELFTAMRDIHSIDGKLLSTMSADEKQKKLLEKIKNGRQLGAMALIGSGAKLDPQMAKILCEPNFALSNPHTYLALAPFLAYAKSDARQDNPVAPSLESTVLDLKGYIAGEGGFVHQEPFSHEDLANIKHRHQNNPVLNAAFSLVKGLDIANQNDISILGDFLKKKKANIKAQDVIASIENDSVKLQQIWQREGNNMSLPTDDSFSQLLKANGAFYHAKKILKTHPEIAQGKLNVPLDKFRNKQLVGLKTAFAYAAKLAGADEQTFNKLKGFYQAQVPHGNAHQARLLFGNKLYVPANGYILGADQLASNDANYDPNAKAAITDCSGLMTDVLRATRPDLTWLQKNRLQSWGLETAHDAKFLRREDVGNQEGPIQSNGVRRAHLSRTERHRLNNWVAENPKQFETVDKAFDTVKKRSDIRSGDFIVYRQRRNGKDYSSDTGHVALVVDHAPDSSMATLLEYTRSGGHDGVGFTRRPLCYGREGNTVWETRVLRPK